MSYTNVIDLSCTNLHVYNLENADFVDMSQNITDISSIVTDISQSVTNNKLSLLREKLLNTEGDNVVITFEDGTTISTLDDAMGLTGPTGFQDLLVIKYSRAGYQGATGPTGFQGYQVIQFRGGILLQLPIKLLLVEHLFQKRLEKEK